MRLDSHLKWIYSYRNSTIHTTQWKVHTEPTCRLDDTYDTRTYQQTGTRFRSLQKKSASLSTRLVVLTNTPMVRLPLTTPSSSVQGTKTLKAPKHATKVPSSMSWHANRPNCPGRNLLDATRTKWVRTWFIQFGFVQFRSRARDFATHVLKVDQLDGFLLLLNIVWPDWTFESSANCWSWWLIGTTRKWGEES